MVDNNIPIGIFIKYGIFTINMVFDITKLKEIRKKLGITQRHFSQIAGISQSAIAKIEAGRLDPSYSNVLKIEKAIEILRKKKEKEAREIMIKKVITAKPSEKIEKIIKTMMKHKISQIPVADKGNIIGLVTEASILEKKGKTAKESMIEAPPTVSGNAKISVIRTLLEFYPIIIVKEKGSFIGVITKADLIKYIS